MSYVASLHDVSFILAQGQINWSLGKPVVVRPPICASAPLALIILTDRTVWRKRAEGLKESTFKRFVQF